MIYYKENEVGELVKVIAKALCDFDGRVPDKEYHGVPQWKRYEAQAQTVLNAVAMAMLKPDLHNKT